MAFASSSPTRSKARFGAGSGNSTSRLVLWCLYLVVGLTLIRSLWHLPELSTTLQARERAAVQTSTLEQHGAASQLPAQTTDGSVRKTLRHFPTKADALKRPQLAEAEAEAVALAAIGGATSVPTPTSPVTAAATTKAKAKAKATPKPTQPLPNTGIIISLFDQIIPLGVSLIKELRCLGNHEVIHVVHCFPDEISDVNRERLLKQDDNLKIIDVCTEMVRDNKLTLDQAKEFKSWWLKPLALIHTKLQHVMILDADAILMKDPAMVRHFPGYQQTGTLFFYDRVYNFPAYYNSDDGGKQRLHKMLEEFDYDAFNITGGNQPSKQLQQSFAYNGKTCYEMDSSMLFVDKSRTQRALDVLFHLITKARHEIDFSYGDKESFWIAFELSHTNYTFSPWGISVLSSTYKDDLKEHPDTLCGAMAQYVPTNTSEPEILYLNGRVMLEPFSVGQESMQSVLSTLFKSNPTHVSPRLPRTSREDRKLPNGEDFPLECLTGLGATPLNDEFHKHLLRRRMLFLGVKTGTVDRLDQCFYSPSSALS